MKYPAPSKLIIFVAVLASLLEIIDASIVNVALPSMMGNLGATLEDISMVVTGYAIANAIILPVSSWLSERWGRRRYYIGCIIAFTVTSVLCGIAPNLTLLIIFRILQGLAGGALLPTSQALIYEQFPKEKAGMAGAIFGMSIMVGPALGPVLGGYLTDQFGWRSIFNVNLPLGLLAVFLGLIAIQDRPKTEDVAIDQKRFDLVGFTALVLGIGCLQFVLERGEADDWFASNVILINSLIAIFAIPFFIWWELRVKDPIINIRLFADALVRNGVMLMGCLGFFLYAVIFLLPIFFGQTYHYDATQTGAMFIPGSILTMAMMPIIGRLMQSGANPKVLIFVGFTSLQICCLLMTSFSPMSAKSEILRMLYMRGFALSFLFVPINSSILSQFKGAALGQVAGMLNLFRQIGGSMGVATVATLLNYRSHQNYLDLSAKVTAFDPIARQFLNQAEAGLGRQLPRLLGHENGMGPIKILWYKVQAQVFMMTFLQLVYVIMGIIFLGYIPLFFLRLNRQTPVKVVDAH